MKICNDSSGLTFPLPPDGAGKPCQSKGRGGEVRQGPECQKSPPSTSQLFLSKAVLSAEDRLTGESSVAHTVPSCAPDE